MQQELTIDRLADVRNTPVYSGDGEKIGKVEEIFYDQETRKPEWIGIGTGAFGTKRVLVPVEGASLEEDAFRVPYPKDQVKNAPDVDADEIDQQTEQSLYSYYGLGYSEQQSDTGLPEGTPDSPGDTTEGDGSVVRSEEELRVGKRDVEAGSVRLRKWVETEPVQMDVELRRETARVTREPIEQPVSGAEIGDERIEMQLSAEEAVVQKQAVAKERIGLQKDVETEREVVSDQVRKERVDVEGDVDRA